MLLLPFLAPLLRHFIEKFLLGAIRLQLQNPNGIDGTEHVLPLLPQKAHRSLNFVSVELAPRRPTSVIANVTVDSVQIHEIKALFPRQCYAVVQAVVAVMRPRVHVDALINENGLSTVKLTKGDLESLFSPLSDKSAGDEVE